MKTTILFTFLLLTELLSPNVSQPFDFKQNQKSNEDFFKFLESFSLDEKFQLTRIKFPLLFIYWNESLTELDTSYVQSDEWEFRHFYFTSSSDSYGQVYDNFDHKLQDTDERVFAWHGIGNGINKFLYFKRINGLWYLIKEENLST